MLSAMLTGQLAHVPPVPPAWRATQLAELGGQVQGAPPCLSSLTKVGRRQGQRAAWLLGSYRGSEELGLDLDVLLQLDRNPDEPCCKLLFVRSSDAVDLSQPEAARRSKDRPRLDKVGHMLLACDEGESALRGLLVAEELRGRGLSRLLLALWLRLCAEADVTPTTRMLNKPLLSLSLQRLGFTPVNAERSVVVARPLDGSSYRAPPSGGVGQWGRSLASFSPGGGISRGSELPPPSAPETQAARLYHSETLPAPPPPPPLSPPRIAFVRTEFEPPCDLAALDEAVEQVLRGREGGGRLRAAASGTELRHALTLRGGAAFVQGRACRGTQAPERLLAPLARGPLLFRERAVPQQRRQPVVRPRGRLSMMARWRDEDLRRKSKRVPAEVEALLAREFPSKAQVGICWAALRDCYASEAEAIDAARRYPSLVLPYMNTPSNIVGCYGTLVGLLGVQGAREVCVKNPAVLGNNPSSLAGCTAKEVRDTADLREFVDTQLPFGLRAWTRAAVALVVVGIGAALLAPAPS